MIKYLDKLRFPSKYKIVSGNKKSFKSIDDWIIFEKKRRSNKHFYRKNKHKLPYVYIVNLDTNRMSDMHMRSLSNDQILDGLFLNHNFCKLYFSLKFDKVVFAEFDFNSDTHYLDFDVYFGNIQLNYSKAYSSKYKDLFVKKSNTSILKISPSNRIYSQMPSNIFIYGYYVFEQFIYKDGSVKWYDTVNNNHSILPIYCLSECRAKRPIGTRLSVKFKFLNHNTDRIYSEEFDLESRDEVLRLFEDGDGSRADSATVLCIEELPEGQWF